MLISKKEWTLILLIVLAAWFFDFITKQWALQTITGIKFYGYFGLVLHRNPGAMLGMFSDLPPILRVVSLSTGGAFLIFIYTSIQYLLPMRSMSLRIGMSLLLGGILGNVTDRMIWGSVVDFLLIGSSKFSTPAFNVADAIQWIGYGLVVYALIKDGQKLWPSENIRQKIWVLPKFQLKYCFILMFIGFGFSIVAGVFTYSYLQVMINDLAVGSTYIFEKKYIHPFLFTYFIICLGFMVVLFLIGRVLSHRMAGPIYAFEKFLDDLIEGRDRPLKLRSGDELKLYLEEIAEKLREQQRNLKIEKEQATLVKPSPNQKVDKNIFSVSAQNLKPEDK